MELFVPFIRPCRLYPTHPGPMLSTTTDKKEGEVPRLALVTPRGLRSVERRAETHTEYTFHHQCVGCRVHERGMVGVPSDYVLATPSRKGFARSSAPPTYVMAPEQVAAFMGVGDRWCYLTKPGERATAGMLVQGTAEAIEVVARRSRRDVYPRASLLAVRDAHLAFALSLDPARWPEEMREIEGHVTCAHCKTGSTLADCHHSLHLGYTLEDDGAQEYLRRRAAEVPGWKMIVILEVPTSEHGRYPHHDLNTPSGKPEHDPVRDHSETPRETAVRETMEESGVRFSTTLDGRISPVPVYRIARTQIFAAVLPERLRTSVEYPLSRSSCHLRIASMPPLAAGVKRARTAPGSEVMAMRAPADPRPRPYSAPGAGRVVDLTAGARPSVGVDEGDSDGDDDASSRAKREKPGG